MALVTKCNVKLGKDKTILRGTKIDKKSEHFKELSEMNVLVEESGEVCGELSEQVATLTKELKKATAKIEEPEKDNATLTEELKKASK